MGRITKQLYKRYRQDVEKQQPAELVEREATLRRRLVFFATTQGFWLGTHIVSAVASGGLSLAISGVVLTYHMYTMLETLVKHHIVCKVMAIRSIKFRPLASAEIVALIKWSSVSMVVGELTSLFAGGAVHDMIQPALAAPDPDISDTVSTAVDAVQADPAGAAMEAMPYVNQFLIETAAQELATRAAQQQCPRDKKNDKSDITHTEAQGASAYIEAMCPSCATTIRACKVTSSPSSTVHSQSQVRALHLGVFCEECLSGIFDKRYMCSECDFDLVGAGFLFAA
ncbi:hypothetical protein OC835_005827 [Tilletia horrida]|nr:hypothetical protein OC835_005827 [Tilletia horrida]